VNLLPEEIRLRDVVEMRRKHPCGSVLWTVTRIGADIKMKCNGCGRVVMMDRVDFIRRRRKTVTQGPDAPEVTLGLSGRAPEPPHPETFGGANEQDENEGDAT